MLRKSSTADPANSTIEQERNRASCDLPCEGAVYLGRLEADETKKQERGAERIDDREERAQGEPEFAKGKENGRQDAL